MSTTTNLSTLKINYLTQSQYDTALANNQINADELYFTPDSDSGASYTATSPIDITNDVISHETSGVTAGTYGGYGATKSAANWTMPSITVDAKGHVTAAANSTALPPLNSSTISSYQSGLVDKEMYKYTVSTAGLYVNSYTITAGSTTASWTISNPNYVYNYSSVHVLDIKFFDATTREPLLVDWVSDSHYSATSVTVTVTLAQAYTNNIYATPIVSYASMTM